MRTELVSVKDFCEIAGCGRTKFYDSLKLGELKAVKYGKRTFVRRADLEDWLASLRPYAAQGGKP